MFSDSYLTSQFSEMAVKQAKLYLSLYDEYVQEITLEEDTLLDMWELSGVVTEFNSEAHPVAYLSKQMNFITDFECDCKHFRHSHSCSHIPALILKYQESGVFQNKKVRKSDYEVMSFLENAQKSTLDNDVTGLVRLYPNIRVEYDELIVDFEIGIPGVTRKYIIRDLSSFVSDINNGIEKKYGAQLEFVHRVSSFDSQSRDLVILIKSIVNREDSYLYRPMSYSYGYYSYNASTIKRELALKGRYLDAFLDAISSLEIYHDKQRVILHHEMPLLPFEINKDNSGQGYNFKTKKIYLVKGYKNLLINTDEDFYVVNRESEKLVNILEYMHNNDNKQHFIADDDLPVFAKNIYPYLKDNFKLKSKDFDPSIWLPLKPKYEMYLDLTKNDTVTCGLFALYGDKRYNISMSNDIQSVDRRDVNDEIHMNKFVSQYFNSVNPSQKNFNLRQDDDKLYELLAIGIPSFQQKADVYISDNLKKISLKKMPKVTVGVSVNQNNLLDIHMMADNMSMQEVSEILAKYDRKKKYYRLKSGELIDLSDNEAFNEINNLAETLRLKTSDIAEGESSVPMYRALYLDSLQDDVNLELDRDKKFRELISNLKNTDIDEYDVPKELNGIMRDYQKEGFRWLSALYKNGFGALLADDMGLGKTLQVLSFLKAYQKGKTLIACPASLVYNWYSEIKKFTPELSCKMIQGPQEFRKYDIQNSEDNTILITSYDTLKRDIDLYKDVQFQFEVIDEAQFIKNAGTQASRATKDIHATFKIALTGTPIENRLSEMWSIFDYLMPGFFYSYRYFKEAFEMRIVRDKDPFIEAKFQKMIRPFVLRRMKKDVLKDLPEKIEEVYYAKANDDQRELYDAHVARIKANLGKKSDDEFKENKIEFLAELTKLRQLCCDPKLLYENYTGDSAKEELCLDLVKKAIDGGHKVLLFSQFTSMLDILTKRLESEHIPYYLLEGSTPKSERAKMVEAFQKDETPVFCISLKAGGTGLNLTAADIVIHYDPWWNTAVENQASDRAHRIGQQNVVSVYRLIVKDTIEERILALQSDKADLADRVMNGEGISSASLSRDDFLELLD